MSFACYASRAVGGGDALNSTRLIRAGAWALAFAWSLEWIANGVPNHLHPMLFVGLMLAFSEIVSGTIRFKKILRSETLELEEAHRHTVIGH